MNYNKIFFPIGGGNELKERIHGALLIGKFFNSHLEMLKAEIKPSKILKVDNHLSPSLLKELNAMLKNKQLKELTYNEKILEEEAKALDIKLSNRRIKGEPTAEIITGQGFRSKLIEEESKYCDLVIVAAPPKGKLTATFETTITKSGKPALMFPREMKSFSTDKILIGWNNSPEIARAVAFAIPLMKKAKIVHIVTSKEYSKDIEKLQSFLLCHDIETHCEEVKTTKVPGEALLNYAKNGKYDLIVAGAFGHKGFKELMFGGTTKYLLKNTHIPVFMSH